ncbi:phospholipase A-2-activating protein-like [Ylistrum balloti]|uniref:phospholipase A-2-activating protein-like n=1 Tax=Ylistrum balloti TaxID=509963 RepID=UPI002905D2AB|nr:phospholipase A-2-activating protein-like [Ylistrum balloti]
MAAHYKLRCSLAGHQKDIRAVAPALLPQGSILSGSRDVTAKIWVPNESDPGFREAHVMSGHTNFISSVCYLPPDGTYSHGLILTGSNDSTILAFTLDSPEPVYKLTGHSNTVCSLASGKFGTLLSGSWDKTAKVWLNKKCVMTLEGHESAVWAVAILPEQGYMLTGSADKSIKIWKAGKCEKTLTGHEDCVRDIAVLKKPEFLSCSNDATIRHWSITGDCIGVYYGHENFVYSLSVLPNGEDFVSSGEDRTVRVWQGGQVVQTIAHPSMSVWSVCVLANGDIVSGSSDGFVRVFTTHPEKTASTDLQKAFEAEVASAEVPTQIGEIQKRDLPGPEALLNPGNKDGQTKMVKKGDKVEIYHWEAAATKWTKIGDVVGSSGGTQKSSGKTLYEGKEYDFVFSVDIEEGKPPLKLPYNKTEDPWFAAQRFLEKNNLSQLFLDQVANFITENTEGVTFDQTAPQVSDPFTGGGRYIPGAPTVGGKQNSQPQPVSYGADPFTGSGSYQPATQTTGVTNTYFPQKSYVTFDTSNPAQIIGKLKELNSSKVEKSCQLPNEKLEELADLIQGKSANADHLTTMMKILTWPHEAVFPALDVLRIAIKDPFMSERLCTNVHFVDSRLMYLSKNNTANNQMLTLRTLCNMFRQHFGETLAMQNRERIITAALECRLSPNKHVQIALSTLLLNYAVFLQDKLDEEGKSQCLLAMASVLENNIDSEAVFRLLVCLGTLIKADETAQALARSLDIKNLVEPHLTKSEPSKVPECATFILELL